MSAEQERFEVKQICTQMRAHLSRHFGIDPNEFPKGRIYSDGTSQIPRYNIVGAVALLVSVLGLSGGSVGDIDLYQLLISYLHDDIIRTQINEIIGSKQ